MQQLPFQRSSIALLRGRGRETGGLGFANGEKPPARQGGPTPTARVPAQEPANGSVSPRSRRPRTTLWRGSESREERLGAQGEREGELGRRKEGWREASLPPAL